MIKRSSKGCQIRRRCDPSSLMAVIVAVHGVLMQPISARDAGSGRPAMIDPFSATLSAKADAEEKRSSRGFRHVQFGNFLRPIKTPADN